MDLFQTTYNIAGWSSLEARRAHNPKVIGSNPIPATYAQWFDSGFGHTKEASVLSIYLMQKPLFCCLDKILLIGQCNILELPLIA